MNKQIDMYAPLNSSKGIYIEAPLILVWELLTDIEKWVDWQTDVSSATLEGSLVVGSVFIWKAKGLSIKSALHTVEPQHRIGWTGKSLGMYAIHNWTMQPTPNGTHVQTEESLSGWFARLLKMIDPHFLDKSLETNLTRLKTYVEKRSKEVREPLKS